MKAFVVDAALSNDMLLPEELELLLGDVGAIVTVRDDGIISFASPAACKLLGWDASIVGLPLTTIVPRRLQARHRAGFDGYVRTGQSRLAGSTVRVPALRQDGSELDIDLTIRVFRRPDGSKLVSAAMSAAAVGQAPPGLKVIEDAFSRRLYELI